LGQYREYTTPDAETFERGLRTAVGLLAPVAPHVAEESWATLGNEGFVAEAAWPKPAEEAGEYDAERGLVENTREDVRDIIDIAGIEDPETIEVAVAPEWKHRALRVAIEADDDVVGTVMADDELRTHGEAAADYAKDLAPEHQALSEPLSPDREYDALDRATWLLDREFDAEIVLERAAEASEELASKARPGRPAIEIHEG
ncbi:MAG: leucine--tRNA ligase, partial [Halobacteriales archaeon SW_9_67_24]